ncbi:MAG: EAL domain-containing protein [Actinomycetia bacterium]|nr:EAL domain-containing protein [Actinomycetes bacterium]
MPTTAPEFPRARSGMAAVLGGRIAAALVLAAAAACLVGWASGIEPLTRGFSSGPQMTPWTAVLLAMLAGAILVQSGPPSSARVRVGCGLAVVAGLLAAVFLVEYATGTRFGLDQALFPDAVATMQGAQLGSSPGRPSRQIGLSVLLLALGVGLARLDRQWAPGLWWVSLAAAGTMPAVIVAAALFQAMSLLSPGRSSEMRISVAVLAQLLLVAAALLTRPDRSPVAWILTRNDKWTLVRMAAILTGPPILIAGARKAFLLLGMRHDTAWVLSISLSTIVVGVAAFYLSRHEQKLSADKALLNRRITDSEVRYRLLADNAVDVIAHIRGTQVVWISPSAEAAWEWPRERWIGSDFSHRVHPDDLDKTFAVLQEVARNGSGVVRNRILTASGDYVWVEARGKPYVDAEGNADGMIFAMRVVAEQVVAQQQLQIEKERFESVVGRMPSAISVRDTQGRYTFVNEAYCQMFGQKSVEYVVGRLEAEVLPPDVLRRSQLAAVRLLEGDDSLAEETIQCRLENITVVTQRFPLPDATGATKELVTIRTDITHRKRIEEKAAERNEWLERIGSAIGDGRLLVYSQPIVDIATTEMVEEELLVRLRTVDTEEVLPPRAFLPQCERHGLMPVIDRYMVGRAIEMARAGRHVCVNISGQTIADAAAMKKILDALADAGPPVAENIVVEITETIAVASPAMAKAFSASMRDRGCRVALDDFGTGYGTFNELRHLALSALKIDLSFVQKMLENREDERVVNTIVFVARTYGLTTVAEGVETPETLKKLAELGADRAQGHLFGEPKLVVA